MFEILEAVAKDYNFRLFLFLYSYCSYKIFHVNQFNQHMTICNRYTVVHREDEVYGLLENNSWTGMVGMLYNNV